MSDIVAFAGSRLVGRGAVDDVAVAMRRANDAGEESPLLAFDAESSQPVEVDLRGTEDDIRARFARPSQVARGRGRPKLGVTAREVTLLPRHWQWLGRQRGGASATIRRLIDQARRTDGRADDVKVGKESMYRFMTAMAGNERGYEEAIRALFAGDHRRFVTEISGWPTDVREHVLNLASAAFGDPTPILGSAIPHSRMVDVNEAFAKALPDIVIESIEPMTGGGSGAGVYKVIAGNAAYLLRLDDSPDGFRDPARRYACHKIAGEAGVAPRFIYGDVTARIAISEFIRADESMTGQDRLVAIAKALKRLHDAPLFPPLMPYLDAMRQLLKGLDASGVLPSGSLQETLALFEALAKAYPGEDLVSSHNDMNPHNVLFNGDRALFVDWESAFTTDRYVDLATMLNYFTSSESEESLATEVYFGRPLVAAETARILVMRQVSFLFYGAVLLGAAKREVPSLVLSPDEMDTPRFAEARQGMLRQNTAREKAFSGCVFLNEAVCQMQTVAFTEALSRLSTRT